MKELYFDLNHSSTLIIGPINQVTSILISSYMLNFVLDFYGALIKVVARIFSWKGRNRWTVRCNVFSLLFVSRYSIATMSNLIATAIFTLTEGKRTANQNPP